MDSILVAALGLTVPILAAWMTWMTKKTFDQDKTLALLTTHMATMQSQCVAKNEAFGEVIKQVQRADRNIARIGEHLQVKHMETENS